MTVPFPPAGHVEDSQKRVRVLFNKHFIVDSKKAKLVWEHQHYPSYFFAASEVPTKYLQQPANSKPDTYDIVVDDKRAEGAAVVYTDGDFKGLVKLIFGKMDAWFEEDDQIFVHPKDPYKRVDVSQSSRHVRVEVDGVEVANTTKPRLLFETGLPVRTYIPKTDVRTDLLEPTDLTTACPYKGVANYYSVVLPSGERRENIVWWYRTPQLECAEIRGFAAFYDEKVDVWVDGEKVQRPKSVFS